MRKIKVVLVLILLSYFCAMQAQQTNEENDRLAISIYIPDNINGFNSTAKQSLHNKLEQILTKQDIYADPGYSRFIVTANVIMQEEYKTQGVPPLHIYKFDITFYIGDGYEGKVFSSYTMSITGVGDTKTKAYMNAIRNINPNGGEYQSFLNAGKSKIIAYFNSQCDYVIKEAKTLASMQRYDEALQILSAVPNVCADCWNKCMDVAVPIYQQTIDLECKSLLLEATNVWNAGQNWDAAERAGSILSMINPGATCFKEALALSEKIAPRVREIENREWAFKYDKEINLKRDVIKAYRDIGVAQGEHQPQNITYKSLW